MLAGRRPGSEGSRQFLFKCLFFIRTENTFSRRFPCVILVSMKWYPGVKDSPPDIWTKLGLWSILPPRSFPDNLIYSSLNFPLVQVTHHDYMCWLIFTLLQWSLRSVTIAALEALLTIVFPMCNTGLSLCSPSHFKINEWTFGSLC